MPTRLIQLDTHASGTASLRVTGPAAERLSPEDDLEIAILQPGQQDLYLDPRNPDKPWSTAVFRFRPLAPRRDGGALMLDIDYGVTYHLRANQPYKLKLRQGDALELEERFTGSPSLRRPSAMPQGWTPPPDPRGPVAVPPPVVPPAAAAVVEPTPQPEAPPEPVPVPAPVEAMVEPAPAVEKHVEPAPVEQKRVEPSPPDDTRKTPAPVPVPPRRTPWLAIAVVALVLIGAGVWWLTRNGGPPVPVAQSESDASLAGIRKFLAGNPEPADARARAEALVAKGGQLDSQFLLVKYAAERGDAKAARMMGTFYDPQTWSKERSPLPAPNPLEAARWHKMAAEAGDAESQYRYGMLLRNGGTDEPNGPEMAVGWLRKSAEQGNAEAKKALGQ